MRIMVTGGTGFIGFHTVNRLLDAGHDVKLLIRSEEKMRRLFGDRVNDFVIGDINNDTAIEQAFDDCDGVIHIAALVSIDAADEDFIYQTNFNGTKKIIGGAVKRGIEHIIYVSSVTAVYDPSATILDENTPPGRARKGYGGSKVASEIYVQGLQDTGAPVHITYPATVIGPQAPAITEAHNGLMLFLNPYAPVLDTGNQYVDVRDVAEAHLQLMERKLVAGRFPLGGHFLSWADHPLLFSELTGNSIKPMKVPTAIMKFAGLVSDWLSAYGMNSIFTSESVSYATHFVPFDSTRSETDLELQFRPLEESLRDTIQWLHEEGHIETSKAGLLASTG